MCLALLGPVASGACRSGGRGDGAGREREAVPRTTVRVENRGFLDVNVFVVRSGTRLRLGTVSGNSTAVLTIPGAVLGGGLSSLGFLADPIGAPRPPLTQEIQVTPGDEVLLIIPPT